MQIVSVLASSLRNGESTGNWQPANTLLKAESLLELKVTTPHFGAYFAFGLLWRPSAGASEADKAAGCVAGTVIDIQPHSISHPTTRPRNHRRELPSPTNNIMMPASPAQNHAAALPAIVVAPAGAVLKDPSRGLRLDTWA